MLCDPFMAKTEGQPHHGLAEHPLFSCPCLKGLSGPVRCLSSEFETEAVLVACEGSAEGSWGGFGAEAAILGHVPAEVKRQLFSRARI